MSWRGSLADKRSENTRRAYRCDLNDFFTTMTGSEATPEKVQEFLKPLQGPGEPGGIGV